MLTLSPVLADMQAMTGPDCADKPTFAEMPANLDTGKVTAASEIDRVLELLREAVLVLDEHGLSQAAAYADMARHVLVHTRSGE